jgi:hypothetical protein
MAVRRLHHQLPTRIDRDFTISGQDMAAAMVRLPLGAWNSSWMRRSAL